MAAEELRRHNLAAVLDRLHLSGSISRSELTQITGLNRSTIADLIGELVGLGLVEEGPGAVTAGPGRPSPIARPRPEGSVTLALELSVDSIAAATVGLGGHVYNQVRVARPRAFFTPEETAEHLAQLAGPLISALPQGHRLIGIGVAMAGIVRRDDGFVHLAPNLGWRDVELGSILDQALGLGAPLVMANEADLGALAESRRGAGSTARQMVYIAGEAGIGAGIVQDGHPMLGVSGYAGEVGHMLINPGGRCCTCGARGCWETEAGEAALARRAGMEGMVGQHLADRIVAAAEEEDPRVLEALAETGRWMGRGIGNLINVFNPDRIVVGGIYHIYFPYFEPSLTEEARAVALSAPGSAVGIVRSELGEDAALVGAAELALSGVIADPAAVARYDTEASPDLVEGGA